MLGCRGLAGLDGEGRVFLTAPEASLPYLCFSLGRFSLAKPSSFPWPRFCLCVGHTWLRGASVTSVHLHPALTALHVLDSSWALGKGGTRGSLQCARDSAASVWPGGGPGAVSVTGLGLCPAPPGLWAGVAALRPCAARQEGRQREAEVLQHGGLGEILGCRLVSSVRGSVHTLGADGARPYPAVSAHPCRACSSPSPRHAQGALTPKPAAGEQTEHLGPCPLSWSPLLG